MNELLDPPEKTAVLEPIERPKTVARPAPARPAAPKPARRVVDEEDEDLFVRHRKKLIAMAVLVIGALVAVFAFKDNKPAQSKPPERSVVRVQLPPLPPPPPPPPPKIEQPKQEMIKEEKPEEKPPEDNKPADDPPPLGTGIKGDGPPDGFGLNGSGTGRIGGTGAGGSRSKFGWYGGQVQRAVREALSAHRKTRNAKFSGIEVRIWPDASTGRITRVSLSPSTGDAALDAAIREEVLGGLQLQQPPPEGMPAPIVMRINARRP